MLSGGLDSSTTLYYALNKGFDLHALIFDYGQRHKKEIKFAVSVAKVAKIPYQIVKINLPWKGSSLTDKTIALPNNRKVSDLSQKIPSTYVPGRNTIFLSYAFSYAETIEASHIFIGANAIDYSGYPDCRPEYIDAFQKLLEKAGARTKVKISAPLLHMTKKEIVKLALKLKLDINKTWSCYAGGKEPCGKCDSCIIRGEALK